MVSREKFSGLLRNGPVSRKSRELSGDVILFVPSKRRSLEEWNFEVILMFIPLTHKEASFKE